MAAAVPADHTGPALCCPPVSCLRGPAPRSGTPAPAASAPAAPSALRPAPPESATAPYRPLASTTTGLSGACCNSCRIPPSVFGTAPCHRTCSVAGSRHVPYKLNLPQHPRPASRLHSPSSLAVHRSSDASPAVGFLIGSRGLHDSSSGAWLPSLFTGPFSFLAVRISWPCFQPLFRAASTIQGSHPLSVNV